VASRGAASSARGPTKTPVPASTPTLFRRQPSVSEGTAVPRTDPLPREISCSAAAQRSQAVLPGSGIPRILTLPDANVADESTSRPAFGVTPDQPVMAYRRPSATIAI
jgi:hypothetical protein